jgi:hypothetical protein
MVITGEALPLPLQLEPDILWFKFLVTRPRSSCISCARTIIIMSWFLDWGLDLQMTILRVFFFSKCVTFEPLIVEGRGWSQFRHLFQEIPFHINYLKIDSQGALYNPNKAVGI